MSNAADIFNFHDLNAMKIYNIINEAAADWYSETGIKANMVLMHPVDANELINEVSIRCNPEFEFNNTDTPKMIITQVGGLEIKIAAQEVKGEIVLVEKTTHQMKKVEIVEWSEGNLFINKPKVLISKYSQLFLIRSFNGIPRHREKAQWSERLLREVSENYDLILVFHDHYKDAQPIWPAQSLTQFIEELDLNNIEVIKYNSHQMLEAIQIWKERILAVGGRVKKVKNLREINCFNLPELTAGDHITWVDAAGDAKLDIIVEKDKSFMELAKKRESQVNW